MNKKELAQRLARQTHVSQGKAADHVDSLVYSLLKDLKGDNTTSQKPNRPQKDIASAAPKASVQQPAPQRPTRRKS